MKRTSLAAFLALSFGAVWVHAQARNSCQSATVVRVVEHMMPANYIGGVIDGSVPQPQKYFYDDELRLNCDLYLGRYESLINRRPAAFAINHTVSVLLDDDRASLSLPKDGPPLSLVIVSHRRASDQGCASNSR